MTESGSPILIVAGETSGDHHAAEVLAELTRRRPAVRPFGLGGPALAAAGLERVAASDEISVVGITEVARVLGRARRIFRRLLEEVDRRQARVALLVDFPDFNLRLARQLARRCLTIVYYVSPQVWAWRRGRVRSIGELVDRLLVLFPFEVDFYRRHGVEAVHVGHPILDQVPARAALEPAPRQADLELVLLPGSRRSEIASQTTKNE